MRIEVSPRFVNIVRDGFLAPEIGMVPVHGVLNVDEAKISPETYRFIMLEPHLLVDGQDVDQRQGRPSAPWVQSIGDPTNTMLPAGAYGNIASMVDANPPPPRVY